jgi:hypothetical protein
VFCLGSLTSDKSRGSSWLSSWVSTGMPLYLSSRHYNKDELYRKIPKMRLLNINHRTIVCFNKDAIQIINQSWFQTYQQDEIYSRLSTDNCQWQRGYQLPERGLSA